MFNLDTLERPSSWVSLVGVSAMIIGGDDFMSTVKFYAEDLYCIIRLLRQASGQGNEESWDILDNLLSGVIKAQQWVSIIP